VLASFILILGGWGVSTLTSAIHARREQQHFMNNVKENLAIMSAVQRVQNQQNTMLLKQAKEGGGANMPALPLPSQERFWLPALTEFDQPSEVADTFYRVIGEEEDVGPVDGWELGPDDQ